MLVASFSSSKKHDEDKDEHSSQMETHEENLFSNHYNKLNYSRIQHCNRTYMRIYTGQGKN